MQIPTVLESMSLTPILFESAACYISIDKMYNTLKYSHLTITQLHTFYVYQEICSYVNY